jgi:hypothetical protein
LCVKVVALDLLPELLLLVGGLVLEARQQFLFCGVRFL